MRWKFEKEFYFQNAVYFSQQSSLLGAAVIYPIGRLENDFAWPCTREQLEQTLGGVAQADHSLWQRAGGPLPIITIVSAVVLIQTVQK